MYPLRSPINAARSVRLDGSFTRGFVATACLSAFQDARVPSSSVQVKRIFKQALQGGTALAAGAQAANAVQRKDYIGALLAAAVGAAGVLLIDRVLQEPVVQEVTHGEKA